MTESFRNIVVIPWQHLLGKGNTLGEEGDLNVPGNHVSLLFCSPSNKEATFAADGGSFRNMVVILLQSL